MVDGKEGVALQQFKYLVSTSVYTVAGTGEYNDADGSALEATFARPTHLAIDDQGNLIVIDYNSMVRLVSISEARVRTLKVYDDIYGCCFSPDYNILYTGQEGSSRISYIFQRNSNWEASALMNDGTLKYTCDVATIDN